MQFKIGAVRALLLGLIFLMPLATRRADAYYDDVHYALTYYMARQSGYTALQSYRIASLCSQVDTDQDTEPVQRIGQVKLALNTVYGPARTPRLRFHAMRNEGKYPKSVGIGSDGPAAQNAVTRQLDFLFDESVKITKNPGVFLHAFEDEVPHRGYGTDWGHWPVLVGDVEEYAKHKLPIGGTTDWISYRQFDVVNMSGKACAYLRKFMEAASPHQLYRPYNQAEFEAMVAKLAQVNPHPAPIDTELKRSQYVQIYSSSVNILGQERNISTMRSKSADLMEMFKLAQGLGIGMTKEDFAKHAAGPDVVKAIEQVNAALKLAGLENEMFLHPIKFNIDEFGHQEDEDKYLLDQWVLTGSLEFSVEPKQPVTVTLKMPQQGKNSKEYALHGIDPVKLKAGESYKWKNLPIGDLLVEITTAEGKTIRKTVRLDKAENKLPVLQIQEAAPAADFSGFWEGVGSQMRFTGETMDLRQNGNQITGETNRKNRISGTVSGKTLSLHVELKDGSFIDYTFVLEAPFTPKYSDMRGTYKMSSGKSGTGVNYRRTN